MDRLIYFPDQVKPKGRRQRFKWNGITLLCLILFFTLIYQLISGLYQLFIYNRRLNEEEALLQGKRLYLEELETRLQRPELNPVFEIDQE